MGDVSHQYFNGNVTQANGVKVDHQTTIEVHQHFFTEVERRKLHNELMAFQKSDPDFFKVVQEVCTVLRGNFMFVEFKDDDFKKFYEIKNMLFSLYQDKEKHRLSFIEEKAKITQLEIDIAIERNRVALFQQELEKVNSRGVGKMFKRLLGK